MPYPTPGLVVGGKYRILRPLGEGGMGAVFEAEHTLTLKRAAIKWVHPRMAAHEVGRERLLKEARAMSRIRHRNVVQIYDVVLEESALFLVMELLHGEPLSHYLRREPLEVWQLVSWLLPALEGVASAHAAGVIHRDIKPDNIFLARAHAGALTTPKVIDFGISKTFDDAHAASTRSGVAMGTTRYVSFEQLRGLREVDGRSDVYAFGVILYEALLGRPPYAASSFAEQAVQFVTTAPSALRALRPAIPPALEEIVHKAIARDQEQRAELSELIAALRPFAEPTNYESALTVLRSAHELIPPGAAGRADATRPYSSVVSGTHPDAVASSPSRARRSRWLLLACASALAWSPGIAEHDAALQTPAAAARSRGPTAPPLSLVGAPVARATNDAADTSQAQALQSSSPLAAAPGVAPSIAPESPLPTNGRTSHPQVRAASNAPGMRHDEASTSTAPHLATLTSDAGASDSSTLARVSGAESAASARPRAGPISRAEF